MTIRELAELTVEIFAPGKPAYRQQLKNLGANRTRYVSNVDRVRSDLGLDAWTPLPRSHTANGGMVRT